MSKEKIRELLKPFLGQATISASQLDKIAAYFELLEKWQAKINLTAIRDPQQIVTRHFGESFFAAQELFPHPTHRATAIDVGSGAGFPGLPLKIWTPTLELTLVESNNKKATFLREVVRNLKLSETTVLTDRAEQVRDKADLVTLRAVEQFESVLPIAFRLVKPAGRIALLIGSAQVEAAQSAARDFSWEQVLPIPLSRNRVLLVGRSEAEG
jgi:16S rRNA (guanine527-N7)-methyltransferase